MSVKREKAGVRLLRVFGELGWTQEKAAKEFGVSVNMVYKYAKMESFNDSVFFKRMETLKKFNVNPAYLNGDTEEMFLPDPSEQIGELERLRKIVAEQGKKYDELQTTLKIVAEEAGKQTALIEQLTTLFLKPPKT